MSASRPVSQKEAWCWTQVSGVTVGGQLDQIFLLTLPLITSIGCYTTFETELSTEQSGREAKEVLGALT